VATVPVGIQKSQLGQLNTKPAGGMLFIHCNYLHTCTCIGYV